ncbi:uncharacterized protein (DUF885 family) [Herbihabitans rhizosphaerae]|uniref:Uncharacterized protein (DUF885 family) n=1 Tax=Herbihabitans rhizosphaerae TaxID=1872711 RepID=A0A4Q7L728_9PSEU|nr:DUF885 domain-containing protein [Herbihabitans rhizosphaerae]RZS45185.1 uncharacterized protein (DUF885 family) [Herbihabitans rhizosphaerae]
MSTLTALADRYVDDLAALDPCMAATMGIAGQEARLTDYGPDGDAARTELRRRTLAELDEIAAARPPGEVTAADRIAEAMLRERLETEIALAESRARATLLDTTEGPINLLRQAIELLDQGAETPWEVMHSRLLGLPDALTQVRAGLEVARGDGLVAARRQVRRNVQACMNAPAYLSGLADGAPDERVRDAVAHANQALTDLAGYLGDVLMPIAPERDALGRDRYALGVRDYLGTRLDLEETYAWGWEELARIEAEMAAIAGEIRPGASVAEVTAALDADPAYRISGAEEFRAYLQELADQAIADLDGVHFDIPEALRRIDCRIPPTESGIYYYAPAEDLSRPGTVWWSVPESGPDAATWTVPGVMFHEGVPGHHLQLGVTTLNTSRLNRFQRLSSELHPGHAEGWGLYAERLMDELGFYREPAHRLGMLANGQQLRAARVVLDIGLHLELPIPAGTGFHEGERWNAELGREFLALHCGRDSAAFVNYEIDRYLGRPAQAIAYKVGERVWLAARDAVRRREGSAFDLKEFHRDALDLGPMGLDLLRRELVEA